MNKEKLQHGLGLFLDAMRPYAVSIITRECPAGTSWDVDFEQKIDNERKRTSWQMQRMQLNNNGSSLLKYAVAAGGSISNSAKYAIKQMPQMRGATQRIYRNTMLFVLCSEAGRAALNTKLREYLACDKIITEYGSQLDSEQKKDVVERKKQSEQSANEQLIHAYNTVVKCVRDEL